MRSLDFLKSIYEAGFILMKKEGLDHPSEKSLYFKYNIEYNDNKKTSLVFITNSFTNYKKIYVNKSFYEDTGTNIDFMKDRGYVTGDFVVAAEHDSEWNHGFEFYNWKADIKKVSLEDASLRKIRFVDNIPISTEIYLKSYFLSFDSREKFISSLAKAVSPKGIDVKAYLVNKKADIVIYGRNAYIVGKTFRLKYFDFEGKSLDWVLKSHNTSLEVVGLKNLSKKDFIKGFVVSDARIPKKFL